MDSSSLSVLGYMRFKPTGKLKRRIQDLRIPSSSGHEYLASRPALDLSHNESARLAVDSLLSCGVDGYHEVLSTEGEVDFLSQSEKCFIQENGRDSDLVGGDSEDEDADGEVSELVSALSETTIQEPESRCEADQTDVATDDPGVEVYLQSDGRAASTKDVVREFIRKAKKNLVIATDSFSDVELLCDLLEASGKRSVRVHLLLDHLNRSLFTNMWQELQLKSSSFPTLFVHSVEGQTYCARTGRRVTGHMSESFIISDWEEVLTCSCSFSWLSWQIHRGLVVILRGDSVHHFRREFLRLCSSSCPIPGFISVSPLTSHASTASPSPPDQSIRDTGPKRPLWRDTVQHWIEGMEAESSLEKAARTQMLSHSTHPGYPQTHFNGLNKSHEPGQNLRSRPLAMGSAPRPHTFPSKAGFTHRRRGNTTKAHWLDAQRGQWRCPPKLHENSDSRFPTPGGPHSFATQNKPAQQTPQNNMSRLDNAALTLRSRTQNQPHLSSVLMMRPDHKYLQPDYQRNPNPSAPLQSTAPPSKDWSHAPRPRCGAHQRLFYATYRSGRKEDGQEVRRAERSNSRIHKQQGGVYGTKT